MQLPIYLIESSSRQVLAETFMRFQEYYESPEFKGRIFSVEEFTHWYARRFGAFTYSRDWYGFNIPSKVLEPFRLGEFEPLTIMEQKLLDICKNAQGNFYLIGATPNAEYFTETVKHEFVHGAFYVNGSYRDEVISCIREHKIKTINNALHKMGYHPDVFEDEANAYVLVEPDTIQEYSSLENTKKLRERLDNIFAKFFGFSVLKTEVSTLLARTKHILI